jgi:hypothetical protein
MFAACESNRKKTFQVLANTILCDLEFFRSQKNLPLEQLNFRPEDFCRAADLRSQNVLSSHLIRKGTNGLKKNLTVISNILFLF